MPFLRTCVKEGLRLGIANPTRPMRAVPSGPGFVVTTQHGRVLIPGGAVVGCAAYCFTSDPHVFPGPFRFAPGDGWATREMEVSIDREWKRA
ncbi:hypothetical protein F4824DRAFT_476710 [Ustulina deusta]|nr:hypothetical protein F4823DRAFT_609116 [Ustulina deusta]KAI3331089.1 hypothetical protein F4824DRAFT_476710 [Ustulina deusta]